MGWLVSALLPMTTLMHCEIQAKLTIMLRDVAPTYGLGSAAMAMHELLAVYVCCITFMEACGADCGEENLGLTVHDGTKLLCPCVHDCERWRYWHTGARMSKLPGFWKTLREGNYAYFARLCPSCKEFRVVSGVESTTGEFTPEAARHLGCGYQWPALHEAGGTLIPLPNHLSPLKLQQS